MAIIVLKDGKFGSITSGAQYTGDKRPGQFNSWDTIGADPNEFISYSYGELTKRNITLYHTFAAARACVNKPISYIIGNGLKFKSILNAGYIGWSTAKAKAWGDKFTQLVHYSKKTLNWYTKQAMLFRQACISGDAVLYFLREDSESLPFDLIPAGGHVIDWERNDGEAGDKVELGIVTDKYSRKQGFYDLDGNYVPFMSPEKDRNALQFMLSEIPGALRGMGCFYSEIAHAKGFDRVWDATIERMVQESILLGWFKASETDVNAQMKGLAAKAAAARADAGGTSISTIGGADEINPGAMLKLNNTEDMGFNDLKTPSNNFGMANEYFMDMFAMARGYPPEFIKGKYMKSYSAARAVHNDAAKRTDMEQAMTIEQVENPISIELLKHYARTGRIEVPPAFWDDKELQQAMVEGVFIGPRELAINPVQEMTAYKMAVDEEFTTRNVIARKIGNDFDNQKSEYKENEDHHYSSSSETRRKLAEKGTTPEGEAQDMGTTTQNTQNTQDKKDTNENN